MVCVCADLPVIGIVENMSDVRIPLSLSQDSASTGVRWIDTVSGNDITEQTLEM